MSIPNNSDFHHGLLTSNKEYCSQQLDCVLSAGCFVPSRAECVDVSPDGEHFLMVKPGEAQVNVVLSWFQELTERVPVPRLCP